MHVLQTKKHKIEMSVTFHKWNKSIRYSTDVFVYEKRKNLRKNKESREHALWMDWIYIYRNKWHM